MARRSTTISFYAVRDPDDQAHMTLWRRTAGGFTPYAGQLQLPAVRAAAAAKGAAWQAAVDGAIAVDPHAAARDFADLGKCCVCARVLKDRDDQVVGIHQVCRNAMDPADAAAYTEALLASHGLALEDADARPVQ
jgi:hypothetical protein